MSGRLHGLSALSVRGRRLSVAPVMTVMDAEKPLIRLLQNSREFRYWLIASAAAGGRIPSTEAYAAVCQITDAISLDTWKKSVKSFYDQLITKFDIEEAWADAQLKQITK